MKTSIFHAAMAAIAALILAGCAGPGSQSEGTGGGESIVVWTWEGAPGTEAMDALAAQYEAATGVKVQSVVMDRDDYTSQVQLALNAGDRVDVLGVQPTAFAEQTAPMLRSVSEWESHLANGMAGYVEAAVEQNARLYSDGDPRTVPFASAGSAVCFYNADILESVGVDPPATWNEVKRLTEALDAADMDVLTLVKPSGTDSWFEDEFVLTMAGQLDPAFYDDWRYNGGPWNAEAYVAALARYGELFEDGTLQRGALDLPYGDAMNAFNTGKAAITCNGTWEAALLGADFREANGISASSIGVIPVPADDPAARSLRAGLDIVWGIPKTAANVEAAADFISFATQGDGVDAWAELLGYIPATTEWQLDQSVLGDDERAQDGYSTIQELVANPSSDRNNVATFSYQAGTYVLEVAHGRMSAQDAADAAQADWDSGLYGE